MNSWKNIVESLKSADLMGKGQEALEMMHDGGDSNKIKLFLIEELGKKPKSVNLLFAMGLLLEEQEEFHSALEYYDRCLAIKSDPKLIYNKARILIDELDEFDEGLDTLELITIDSDDRDQAFHVLKVGALLGLERFDECEKQCEKILELDKKSISVLFTFADSCYERGDWEKSFELTEKILELDSMNLEAQSNKADLLNLLGKPDESLKITESLISANSGDAINWETKADSQMRKGEFDKAIISLQNATLIDSAYGEAWFSLAKVYSHENRVHDALDAFLIATSLEPELLDELDDPYFENISEEPRFKKLKVLRKEEMEL